MSLSQTIPTDERSRETVSRGRRASSWNNRKFAYGAVVICRTLDA